MIFLLLALLTGPEDHIKMGILQTMGSGVPCALGLWNQNAGTYAYMVFGAPSFWWFCGVGMQLLRRIRGCVFDCLMVDPGTGPSQQLSNPCARGTAELQPVRTDPRQRWFPLLKVVVLSNCKLPMGQKSGFLALAFDCPRSPQ